MTDTTNDNTITLKAICAPLKINPKEARAKLRTARTDAKAYPHLAKHKAGHAWHGRKIRQRSRKCAPR
jgi:hypothetical protein